MESLLNQSNLGAFIACYGFAVVMLGLLFPETAGNGNEQYRRELQERIDRQVFGR